jgi:hypothetical protein
MTPMDVLKQNLLYMYHHFVDFIYVSPGLKKKTTKTIMYTSLISQFLRKILSHSTQSLTVNKKRGNTQCLFNECDAIY